MGLQTLVGQLDRLIMSRHRPDIAYRQGPINKVRGLKIDAYYMF